MPGCSADVLRFDNTYSVIQAKKVSFSVELLLPDSQSQSSKSKKEADQNTELGTNGK